MAAGSSVITGRLHALRRPSPARPSRCGTWARCRCGPTRWRSWPGSSCRSGSPPAGGWPAVARPTRCWRSPSGRCPSASLADAFTTCCPLRRRTSGGAGAWIGTRRAHVRFASFADSAAPALLVAQAIGRLGNWFNQELFGSPTDLPWGLRIDPAGPTFPDGMPSDTLFHPTFLYEMLWNLAAAALLIWLDRRYRWGHGRVFWAYVVA